MISKAQQAAAKAILDQEIEDPTPDETGLYRPIPAKTVGNHVVGLHVFTAPDDEDIFIRGYRKYVRRVGTTTDSELSESNFPGKVAPEGWRDVGKGRE